MRNKYFTKDQTQRISKNTEKAYIHKYLIMTEMQKVIWRHAFEKSETMRKEIEEKNAVSLVLNTTINRKEDLLSVVSSLLGHYSKEVLYNSLFSIYSEKLENYTDPDLEIIEDVLNILSGFCNPYVKVDQDGIHMDFSEEKFQELYMCDWKSED